MNLHASLRQLGSNLGDLIEKHVALAKVELRIEREQLFRRGLLLATGLLWVCLGYLALMWALVTVLATAVDLSLAASIVGVANLCGGAVLLFLIVRRPPESQRPPSIAATEIKEHV